MNHRMVIYMVGQIMRIGAILLALPLIVAIIYGESTIPIFAAVIGASFILGTAVTLLFKPKEQTVYAKEGFVIVSLAWIVLSLIGALPFYLSGEIPSYIDAVFETVSGFTTTGSSVITSFEGMTKGMLFWRSFTHWVGGMGIIVLAMAILPTTSGSSMHIMRAEVPGPIVGKLVPKIRDTARVLYLIYVALTAVQVIFLVCGDMDLFDSLVHSFGTAGTGGFGIKPDSLGSYSSYSQWVITVFMLIFGINFNMFYLILLRKIKPVFKSEELRLYLGIVAVSVAAISVNIFHMYGTVAETVKHSAFQVASVITTTGYATVDFNTWPILSKTILLMLMFVGGCAGSTAGGLKVSRVYLLSRMVKNGIKKMLHPRAVTSVSFEGKTVDDVTQRNLQNYFSLYMLMFAAFFITISIAPPQGFDIETNFSAVVTCFNNVGPGFGLVGPASNFSAYSDWQTVLLTVAMLFGRLEIYPLLFALTPSTWTKKS